MIISFHYSMQEIHERIRLFNQGTAAVTCCSDPSGRMCRAEKNALAGRRTGSGRCPAGLCPAADTALWPIRPGDDPLVSGQADKPRPERSEGQKAKREKCLHAHFISWMVGPSLSSLKRKAPSKEKSLKKRGIKQHRLKSIHLTP